MEPLRPVLVVDDDWNDQELLRAAAEAAGLAHPVVMVRDGKEAMEYLRGTGDQPVPCLVVTDLKMPRCDGFQLLEWLRSQPALSGLPVVVLTASTHKGDHTQALALGARCCLIKPLSYRELIELVRQLSETWLGVTGGGCRVSGVRWCVIRDT